jgi:hypothetical protein
MVEGSTARLLGKLRELDMPEGDYALFGSAPLVACGLLREVHDLDVVARGGAWDRAMELGPVRTAPEGDPVVWLEGGAIEIFGGWLGWDIDVLIDNSQIIDGLPFARLEDVLAFKLSLGCPKDVAHARLIEGYLRGGSS